MMSSIDVQYDVHKWQVIIPLALCEAKDSPQIFAQVRAAAPPSIGLPAQAELQFLTSTGTKWTKSNISELPQQKYIQLQVAGVACQLAHCSPVSPDLQVQPKSCDHLDT